MGTLHCLFNREQISKKTEAHQSFEWGGLLEQQPTRRRFLISSVSSWLEGFVTEWPGRAEDGARWRGRAIAVMLLEVKGSGTSLSIRLLECVLRKY